MMDNNNFNGGNNANWNTPPQNTQNTPNMGAQPPVNMPVKMYDPVQKANLALIFGLVSIIAWVIPIVGLITSCIGITCGLTGLKSSKRGRATAGFVLSIIFLIVSILSWVLGSALRILNL